MPLSVTLGLLRWAVLHLLRHPMTWAWVALAGAAWPLVTLLAPRGIASTDGLPQSLVYELAFIAVTVGCLVGSSLIARCNWLFARHGHLPRAGMELFLLLSTVFVLVIPTLGLPLSAHGHPVFAGLAGVPGLALSTVHMAALTLVLMRLGLSGALLGTALLTLVWVLPAVLDPETLAGRFVNASLAASPAQAHGTESVPAGPIWKERLTPIIGWLGALLLLRSPSPSHALRHPR